MPRDGDRQPPWRTIALLTLAILLVVGGVVGVARLVAGRGAGTGTVGQVDAGATATALASGAVSPSGSPPVAPTLGAVPTAVISFGVSQPTTFTQQCSAAQPLAPLTLTLDNSRSTISVDWWLDIPPSVPHGQTPWAIANPPYGTLPAGQTANVSLTPDGTLCSLLVGQSAPVTYRASLFFGGVGEVTISDTITPPV
jgi:hypothetical protein